MGTTEQVAPFDMLVFGGGGDLAMRKLLPALYARELDGQLPERGRVIGIARSDWNTEQFQQRVAQALRTHIPESLLKPAVVNSFLRRLAYVQSEGDEVPAYRQLSSLLAGTDERTRVFYLATAPDAFARICHRSGEVGIVTPISRVVLEKPIGHDLASAEAVHDQVGRVFDEPRIFRIDHYLGKETVQNLFVLRFGNALFESLWNADLIDHVQITVAESIGVGTRGAYYDQSGALRDMVQNHLLQLLCIIAMEPPASLDPDAVRDEKLKVLRALRPQVGPEVLRRTVRGQYRPGSVAGEAVHGYLEEEGIAADSSTETFVALRAEIANWRWAGVPFFLRTGKRLPGRVSEIIVQYKDVPHSIFEGFGQTLARNQLIIRLQPDEGIKLRMMTKAPGPGMQIVPAHLNLSFADTFKQRHPDAYERLLIDVLRGRPTLFMRRDEVRASWRWVEPILQAWEQSGERPRSYAAGTWGPSAAIALIERDGRTWYEETA